MILPLKEARKLARASHAAVSNALRVYLLGPFRIARGTQTIRLLRRKVESLLAYLVLHPEEHPREKLATLFWGDFSDAQARHSLRTALLTLRKQLGDEILSVERETVQVAPTFPLWVDALEFAKIAEVNAQSSDLSSQPAADTLQSAIALYQGDLLSDFYDDWITPLREHYRTLYLDTLLQLVEYSRSHSDYERAVGFAQKMLASDATNEKAHQHLMFCYLQQGNRGAALQQYEECVRILQTDLGVEPSAETIALYEWIKETPSERPSPAARLTNLPIPLTTFIGRAKEIAALKELLPKTRLLTLTGAGGCGKTRLAIQVATDLVNAYQHGAWWIELAVLTDGALVPQSVAKALGVREIPTQPLIETLTNHLRSRELLLLLDNCEHLVRACAELTETLLSACPNLKILTTSREVLGIAGETAWRVPELSLPALAHFPTTATLMEYDGIRLFAERAAAATPNFRLTEQNASAVAQIASRLDGIPLAIELAAARVKILSVEQIAARLEDRFRLLAGGSRTALPRQQTLRATMDWSYGLLSEQERLLFRRLSVFAETFSVDAVEAVCVGEGIERDDVIALLSSLAAKSLIIADQLDGEVRYRLLDTVRQYAREKLLESQGAEQMRDRHLNFFFKLVEEAEPKLKSPEETLWLERLEREYENLRAALEWAMAKASVEVRLNFAANLSWFWTVRGYYGEASAWLDSALTGSSNASASTRAKALHALGWAVNARGDYGRALTLFEESLALYRQVGDRSGIAFVLNALGVWASFQGDDAKAKPLYEESLALRRELGDKWGIAQTLQNFAFIALEESDYARAEALYKEALALWRELGDIRGVARMQSGLAKIAQRQGDYEQAAALGTEALSQLLEVGDKWSFAQGLEGFATLATARGEPERAARLFGTAETLRESIGFPLVPSERVNYDLDVAAVRTQLDQATFNAAWAEGRAMTLEQALEFVLEMDDKGKKMKDR